YHGVVGANRWRCVLDSDRQQRGRITENAVHLGRRQRHAIDPFVRWCKGKIIWSIKARAGYTSAGNLKPVLILDNPRVVEARHLGYGVRRGGIAQEGDRLALRSATGPQDRRAHRRM